MKSTVSLLGLLTVSAILLLVLVPQAARASLPVDTDEADLAYREAPRRWPNNGCAYGSTVCACLNYCKCQQEADQAWCASEYDDPGATAAEAYSTCLGDSLNRKHQCESSCPGTEEEKSNCFDPL